MKALLFGCDDEICIRFKVGTKVYAHSISRVGFLKSQFVQGWRKSSSIGYDV